MVLKGGAIAMAPMGDPECVDSYTATCALPADVCRLCGRAYFDVGDLCVAGGAGGGYRPRNWDCRNDWWSGSNEPSAKADMKLNDAQPVIEVNPQTYVVRADGCAVGVRASRGFADGTALFCLSVSVESFCVGSFA